MDNSDDMMGISPQVPLTHSNIQTILNTLVYDGKAEKSAVTAGRGEDKEGVKTVYRLSNPLLSNTGLSRVPCGVCPVSEGDGRGGGERRGTGGEEGRGGWEVVMGVLFSHL